jgi:hypothetical protein
MMMRSTIYCANTLRWIFMVLAHWNNSLRIDMPPHSDILYWFRANKSLFACVFLIFSYSHWFVYSSISLSSGKWNLFSRLQCGKSWVRAQIGSNQRLNFSGQQKQNSSLKIVFSYNILQHSKFSKFSESYLALNIMNKPVLLTIN